MNKEMIISKIKKDQHDQLCLVEDKEFRQIFYEMEELMVLWVQYPIVKAVATGVALLAIAWFAFGPFINTSGEKLFDQNFKPYTNTSGSTRGWPAT